MQIFLFNIANSRLRRYSSGVIYGGTYPNTVFKFNFNTTDWDLSQTKTAVFSYRGENYSEPLDDNNMCRVPEEVLHDGYFLVSVEDGEGLLTNSIRVPVASVPEDIIPDTPGGDCNCGPNMVYVPEINNDKILSWTIQEVSDEMPVIDPVDLNPHDEWTQDGDTVSEYEWEDDT